MRNLTIILFLLVIMSGILAFGNISDSESSVARVVFSSLVIGFISSLIYDLNGGDFRDEKVRNENERDDNFKDN